MLESAERRRYRIYEVIGRGGFGMVYRAELQSAGGFSKQIALKLLRPELAGRGSEHLGRLRAEARMLALVQHRVLVGVDGLVNLGGRWAVAMEYVAGASLEELLAQAGPLPLPIALQIVEEVAAGLHAAHTARDLHGAPLQLLHRDVKPSNIRLTPHGEVKLLDFGVARATERQLEGADTTSQLLGTLPYLAPERLDHESSPRSDVYSLGLTLVTLLTDARPNPPTADPERHASLVEDLCARMARAGAPESLCELVRRSLSWNAPDRPDAREFERECRVIRTSRPDRPLAEWAEQHVGRLVSLRAEDQTQQNDGLVGMVLEETVESPSQDTSPLMVESPSEPAPLPTPTPTPTPTPSPLVPAPLVPTLSRRIRPWRWLLLVTIGILLGLGLSAAAVLSAAAGGTAVMGALIVAALSEGDGVCVSTVRSTRQQLHKDQVAGLKRGAPLFERAVQGCRDGTIGFWGAAFTMSLIRTKAEDGDLSEEEVTEVTEFLETWGG
jgi:serine/threonine protein kinase